MTTGPRVDIIKDDSTFFWCYAFLTNSSRAFSVQLSPYHGKGLRSADDLSSLFFVLREFFPEYIRDIGTVQSGVITKASMIRSTTAGTSTSVGSVILLGCGASSVKGSSLTDGVWICSQNTSLGMSSLLEPIFAKSSAA